MNKKATMLKSAVFALVALSALAGAALTVTSSWANVADADEDEVPSAGQFDHVNSAAWIDGGVFHWYLPFTAGDPYSYYQIGLRVNAGTTHWAGYYPASSTTQPYTNPIPDVTSEFVAGSNTVTAFLRRTSTDCDTMTATVYKN